MKRVVFIFFIFTVIFQSVNAQIPGLTVTRNTEHKDIYLKSKIVWITLTPFFVVDRRFSPDEGSTYLKVGMLGGNLKSYVIEDSIAVNYVNNYKLTRIFGLAQMGVVAPLLAYKHFTTEPGVVSTGDEDLDNSGVVLEEETGYLTAAIIVFLTGTLTYHVFSKSFLFKTLDRYNIMKDYNSDFDDFSMNLNFKLDPYSQTPQLSLVFTF